MPTGPFGEILGTTGTLETLSEGLKNYKSKVIAPRNPKLVKGEQADFKIKPSQFMFQMSLDTEKKLHNMHTMKVPQKVELLDMAETTHQKVSVVNIDEPMFQPFPSEIVFQNFESFETYEVPLLLRNNDKVPRLVKVAQEDSPYFKIISPHNAGHKVGPGLPTTFKVQFTPEAKKDYNHELVCITEREKFVVPVRAIGARAILDFPDEINFSLGVVKYPSSRTLLVRNIGNQEAKFSLSTEKPFTVSPDNGTLAVNDSIQITVEFQPMTVGDHLRELVLHYDTGENIYIDLYGAASDANVRLDKNSIRIENTFISMANQRVVSISNRSDVIAHFRWTQYATQDEENQQKLMFCSTLEEEENSERDRFLEECIQDPSLRDKMSILSHSYRNKQKLVASDNMLFMDDVIRIEPVEGDIWPNSSAEVTIVFKPENATTYTRTAFCDVTGRESRLPLRIRGDGSGPKVQFSFDTIDIGNIFVNSTHTYEVVLANKGDIDAIFNLMPSKSVFQPQFNPMEGIVMPDGHQAIQITFSSSVLGDFEEDFHFQIDGAPEKLKLTFKGSVIGPTFHFDVPKLKFGTASYGFVNSQLCSLVNTSLVPMKYTLRVPGDGTGDSMCSTSEYDSAVSEAGSNLNPKEFEITPSSGTLPPKSEAKIQVDLCSNTVKKYDLAMVVDIEGVGDEVLSLPIAAKCIVPHITVLTPILDYSRCFLRHPYEHHVKLQNDTDLPAKYDLVAQQVDEYTPILYTSPQPKGVIPPRSIMDVPLIITPQGLEELEITAHFVIFGCPEAPLPVHVMCIGEGPVIHVMPLDLDWRQIPVLQDTPKIVRLSNESLIPAKFTAHMVRPNSVWRVEPNSGEIPPEKQMELTVTACLDDCVRFQDKLQINFLDAPTRMIPVTAYGHGTTIVSDPPMTPTLNLGPHFSKGPCKRMFTLTNSGRRHQSLVWSTEGFAFIQKPKRGGALQPINPKDMRYKDAPPPPALPCPTFRLEPQRMELNPGESIDVTLEGQVDTPQMVRERMLCHAIIGRAGGKELIMKVQINCEFINPLLEFSTDQVFFRIDKQPEDELSILTEELVLSNVSSLPLTTQLSLKYPFTILMEEEQVSEAEVYLGMGESKPLQIQFDPAFKEDAHIRITEEELTVAYKEHPHVDKVSLKGEVYMPNLEFEKTVVDFGCILNDTEVTRYLNITNNSPMDVNYKWSFLIDDEPVAVFHKRAPPAREESMVIEDIEGQRSDEGSIPDEEEEEKREMEEGEEFDEQAEEEEKIAQVELNVEGAESPQPEVLAVEGDTEKKPDPENAVPDNREIEETAKPATEAEGDAEEEERPEKGELDAQEAPVGEGEVKIAGGESRPGSRMETPRDTPAINPTLQALLQQEEQREDLGVEEIFDILPLYGTLKPGETEQITLTFYGHADIGSRAKAVCEVEGGPTYEVMLKGEASLVNYSFDCMDLDYGKIMFDQVAVAEITLINSGKVGFEFTAIGMDPGMATRPKPGVPVMIPHTGFIDPLSHLNLTIKFLPGVPQKFHKSFAIQVAHFEPETINLFGEGVFPRISLDLPRGGDAEGHYESLVKEARENLTTEMKKKTVERPMSAVSTQRDLHREEDILSLHHDNLPSELEVAMEVERLVVQEFAAAQIEVNNRPDVLEVHPPPSQDRTVTTRDATTTSSKRRKKYKPRPRLPDYVLDFGHVVLGSVRTHVVRATNTGWFATSFSVDHAATYQYGFSVELDRVKQLPGAPDHETVNFVISFDPRGANLGLGEVETVVPINLVSGPQLCILLRANVTMPDMQISTDVLDFEEVKCGECKVITVQLFNHKHVKCEWNSLPSEKEKKKIDKHVPMHLRRGLRQDKSKPRTFEMMPATGFLMPGQRQNVQVKFMPTEEKFYENRIAIRLAQSSQRIMLLCRGQGLEPHIEFDRNLVEFGPVLPHSAGDEQEIVVRNPCKFPIEVYNLEFDKTFLEEEKILRLMKGYDEYNTILLPPRGTGDKLPPELLDYYQEQMKKLEEAERARREEEEAAEAARREQEEREAEAKEKEEEEGEGIRVEVPTLTTTAPSRISEEPPATAGPADGERTDRSTASKEHVKVEQEETEKPKDEQEAEKSKEAVGVGELEITPVSAAIARHLGIDLSPEGKAARNRRGIALIIHGAPLSGKTVSAVALAKKYEASLLTIDNIVLEAISNGNSPAGLKARELCAEAAQRHAEETKALEGEEVPEGGKKAGGLSVEALTAHTQGTGVTIGQIAAAHSVAQSLASNRKTSTISDQKSKADKHHSSTVAGKTAVVASSGEGGSQDLSAYTSRSQTRQSRASHSYRRLSHSSQVVGVRGHGPLPPPLPPQDNSQLTEQVPSSPLPLSAPIARRLSVSASVAGEAGLMSCVLPEEILVEILAERLMLSDCHRGVVFDGLETLFSQTHQTSAHAILKALNNRKYMFFVTLKLDYNVMKEQERAAQDEKERQEREHEEAERRRLEDMSEDEYDALDEEDKAEVDLKRLAIKKERLKKEEERLERERREQEEREAELRRLEEEKSKGKKKGKSVDPKDGKKSQAANKVTDVKSQDRLTQLKSQEGKKGHGESEHTIGKSGSSTERPESRTTERGESAVDESRRKKGSKEGRRPISTEEGGKGKQGKKSGKGELGEEEAVAEEPKIDPTELLLMQRFRTFEHSYKEVNDLVDHWERSTGLVRPTTPVEGGADAQDDGHAHPPSGRKTKKDKHDKNKEADRKAAVEKANREAKEQPSAIDAAEGEDGQTEPALTEEEKREKRLEEGIGLPHIILEVVDKDKAALSDNILDTGKLPAVEEVLDGLGLGPRGPPIPPPAAFAVVPYPVKRHAPPGADGHYQFIAASPDDPNIGVEEKPPEPEEEDKSVTPDSRKEEHPTPTRGKKGSDKLQTDGKKDKRKTSAKGQRPGRRSSMANASPPPGAPTPASETDGSTVDGALTEGKPTKLTIFRWTVPAEGEVTIKLCFVSEDLGQFDQTMNFEIMGTRRRYQLYCRGVCAFPTISREPRIVFPNRKKSRKFDEIVHKKYILTSETFEFGPLLVGKSREKYKEGRFPENMEKLTVLNTSPLDADISFCFLNDSKGETYLLDPPTMLLKPGESQDLTTWAYPKVQGCYEDALVCCVKENPEPIIFKLQCHGVRPELELDKEVIHFEKVLLHRKDTKTLYLRNSTLLPVAWRLNGLENLGDDFSVSQESGIIEAKSEFALHAYFRAMKAVNNLKKAIRLEVSDKDNIMGLVQTKNIQVHAEAYDVALDMSFPRGADGGIDFDVIRVTEEHKQQCSLKNKGKYDISYEFLFEETETCPKDICDMFSVIPQKGTLAPVDRPAPVQVIFKSQKEVFVKDQPILRCQIIEPNIGDKGETIASIPIKMSVKSVFSRYNIFPINDINFGSMLINSKKTKTFTIENKGDKFEFKYTISKMVTKDGHKPEPDRRSRLPARGSEKQTKSRDGSSSGRSVARPRRAESVSDEEQNTKPSNQTQKSDLDKQRRRTRQDVGGQGIQQSRLQLGMFTVYPAFGIILPGGHTTITVECVTESPCKCEEEIAIDITGRDPKDHAGGIPYKLIGEACQPSINVADVGGIFEEHRVCKNLSLWQHSNEIESGGVYGEDENRFVFNNVLVGARAKARFKISNSNKVPCDVIFNLKPIVTKLTKNQDVFEVEPSRAQISAHSHVYANVTFSPPSMQHFSAIFEATIDGISPSQAKSRNLVFELSGEGNLPRISIQRPTVRNKKGQPLLLFRRNLIRQSQALPLNIKNDGTLPSKVDIDLVDPDGAFSLKASGDTQAIMANSDQDNTRRPHTASVIVDVGECATFDAIFCPSLAQRSQGQLRLSVVNNQYEDTIIQLVGEGYEDDITLDNIHGITPHCDPEEEDGNLADDDVPAAKSNHLRFGDCYVGEPRTLTFTMRNHSKDDCVRFQWPEHPQLKFAPQVGHLHGGCSKDMTVVFKTDEPKTFEELEVPCKVMKITFDKPVSEVADWDDRIRTVKWVEVAASSRSPDVTDPQKPGTPVPSTPAPRPAKKKVVETEPEPAFTELPESTRNVDLLVSVISDFSKCKCKTESVHFKDTLMLQTRVYEFNLSNKGSVTMDYNWQIVMENFSPAAPRSVTFGAGENERPPTAAGMVVRDDRPGTGCSSICSDFAYVPFTVEPESGTILPGKKANIKVKFSPLDVNEYEGRLICSIPNLEQGEQGPVVGIKGRSLMPYCHFELEDSDYIRSARRNPELRGPRGAPPGTALDANTRVIEFKNVGVGLRTVMSFCIVNPTSHNYTYQWMNEDEMNPKHLSDFRCLTPEGVIKSGKKTEVTFEFTSSSLDLVESFWKFVIPEQCISVPFLLVGQTQDPTISLDRSHLNFKSLLIGHEAMEMVHIINNEDQPFHFSFEESSLHGPGHSVGLIVAPMHGTIPAKCELPVAIYFTPNSDKEVNFNVVCNVKRKSFPLTLNVKAEGYAMNTIVMWEDLDGSKQELNSQEINTISFGDVEVNEKAIRNIYVINSGKFHFDYSWQLEERTSGKDNMVAIDPEFGGVKFGDRQTCQLSFCPPRPLALRGCDLVLRISNGPSYHIKVQGNGMLPGAHFSFSSYAFGPCFVHRAGMPTDSTTLQVTNLDRRDISVDCLYEPTPHLRHNFEARIIRPKETVDVEFTFLPRDPFKYREVVTFEINGLSKQIVEFLGQGTELKIEVADPRHRMVKLGALRVGQTLKKQVPIVNNSLKEITFNLAITPSAQALQDGTVLTVSPTRKITLGPKGGTAKVDVTFSPKSRIPQFAEEVLMEYATESGKQCLYQPLFVVNGSCQGIEINLDTEAIPFGAVAKSSSTTRRLVMHNTGDIGARFHWKWERKFETNFSICPVDGYISPGMEVPFDVVFHPTEVSNDIRYDKLACQIENAKPLKLTLTGACTEVTPAREILQFSTHVRQKETKNLMVANRTNMHWQLRPVIDGEYWSGSDTFTVEPQTNKPYELTYKPLTMTMENQKHKGTVFFPLPDGQGLLYNVLGSADTPRANGKISRDVPCKTQYTEMLTVNNWLKKPQRFKVRIDYIRPDRLDPGTMLKTLDYIDVPGNSKREQKLGFYAHKEGQSYFKVVFTNEQTGEYQFYEVTIRAVRPGVISSIDLTTPVRQSIQHTVELENPLSYQVAFSFSCNVPEILMPGASLQVPPESKYQFNFEYLPLKVGETQGRLEFNCNDLGLYMYDLNLKATAAGPERALYFRTCLGTHQTQVAKFLNFSKSKTDYVCKVENPDFKVDKSVAAAPASSSGTEIVVEVTYEPSRIGESRDTLSVSSTSGGDYTFPLFGTAIAPKPQGPFTVKSGSNTNITFRNVFQHTTAFTFQVDNPLFHVSKPGENIRSHKDHRIVVGFDGNDSGSKAAVMGKLVVSCAKSAGGTSNAQWVYYLKGVTPENTK